MTREQAFDEFLAAVRESIPESVEDWDVKRKRLREAGLRWCHAAVDEGRPPEQLREEDRFRRGVPGHPDNDMGM